MLAVAQGLFAQKLGLVQGTIKNKTTQEPIVGANVVVQNTSPMVAATTNAEGVFLLKVPIGTYNLQASFVGFKPETKFNIEASTGNINIVNFEMAENAQLKELVIDANRTIRASTVETPNSLQRLGAQEIKSNPGGNFDVFKVVQTLPGIGNTANVGNRNDIIVRGGAPGENIYYLDGIEIPAINHFATQGASGGSNGILNVSFVQELTLNTSAFGAQYDNALSSVFQFVQRDGNSQRMQGNLRLSSSELAATLEGPLGPKTTFLSSVRRSYLQYLFQAIDLAIRPNYWDFQYKVTHKFNNKTSLTAIGVGAIDDFYTDLTRNTSPTNAYIIKNTPVIKQWNYTTGLAFRRLLDKGILNVALSRNMSDNNFSRFEDGLREDVTKRLLSSTSQEIENKLRIDVKNFAGKWTIGYGGMAQYVKYNNDFNAILRKEIRDSAGVVVQPALNALFKTDIAFWRFGAFAQVSRKFLDSRLGFSAGLRTDANSFTNTGGNPIPALSPRASLAYDLSEKWKISASVGSYAKLPAYTVLGYKNNLGNFTNTDAKYITSTHYVLGTEYIPRESSRITLEGFYKSYKNYPVSVADGISLANLGSDFGAIGNEDIVSSGKGNAMGIEVFLQQKLTKNLFGFMSYTYVISKFSGADGKLIPSAWDNRHLVLATLGKKFNKGWEMGLKYRYAGGTPYTPFDLVASRLNYVTTGQGVLDYTKINTERLKAFQQFDFRMDKKLNFKRASLDIYLDVTNALLLQNQTLPSYVFERNADNTGFLTTDGLNLRNDGSNGVPRVDADAGTFVVPSLGFIFEF